MQYLENMLDKVFPFACIYVIYDVPLFYMLSIIIQLMIDWYCQDKISVLNTQSKSACK